MRPGTWDGAVSTDNLRVIVDGITVPAASATIDSSMYDGHPAAVSSQWCVESTIVWGTPGDISADVPHPFAAGWLPKPGSRVVVQTGDGATGQWWTQHTGVIESTSGSILDGTATSRTVDKIEDLTSRVNFGALLSRMTPWTDSSDSYRQISMCSTYMVDRMLRNPQGDPWEGWHATPPLTWQTVGSAPCQGSLWPERGNLIDAGRIGDPSAGASWVRTDYGLAPIYYTAEYILASPTDDAVLTIGLHTGGSGTGRVEVVDPDGNGFFVGHDRATDEIIYGATTTGTVTYRLPRQGATRVAVRFTRNTLSSQTLTVHTPDGREVTRDPAAAGYPTGWAATRVRVDGRAGIGWWMVEDDKPAAQRWFTLEHVPTARIRVGDIQWWAASRDLPWTDPATWLAEQVQAECAAMWLDDEGVMQWAGRGVLDAQPAAQTITSALDLDDVSWESHRRSIARSVWVKYLSPTVRSLLGGHRQNCASGSIFDLGPGESDGESIDIPDDQDWISIDLDPDKIGITTTPAQLRTGSKYGGALYEDVDREPGQQWAWGIACEMTRPSMRRIQVNVTAGTGAWVPAGHRIKTAVPEVTDDKLASWHHGRPTIRVRSRAIVYWEDGERSLSAGTIGPARYSHDCSWRVQTIGSYDGVGDLMSWLRTVVSAHSPTATSVRVAHDPRRQVGDVVILRDEHVTGVWWRLLITERSVDTEAMTDDLRGRLISWAVDGSVTRLAPGGPTALTPMTDWTREVA